MSVFTHIEQRLKAKCYSDPLLPAAKLRGLPGYKPRGGAGRAAADPGRRSSIETAVVTNPGYDALVCTRLYPGLPATPPPLPRKHRTHRRTHSDGASNTRYPHHTHYVITMGKTLRILLI